VTQGTVDSIAILPMSAAMTDEALEALDVLKRQSVEDREDVSARLGRS
jgi:hypothetical protein